MTDMGGEQSVRFWAARKGIGRSADGVDGQLGGNAHFSENLRLWYFCRVRLVTPRALVRLLSRVEMCPKEDTFL